MFILEFFFKLFVSIREVVTKLITGAIDIVSRYPIQTIGVVVLIASNIGTFIWSGNRMETQVTAKYEKIVGTLNEKIADQGVMISNYENLEKVRKDRISELEKSTKVAADTADKLVKETNAKLVTLNKSWKSKLAAEIKAREKAEQVVNIVNPVTKDEVKVTLDGKEVVCGRLHDTFTEGVNSLVDEVNKTIAGVD